jgi:hypothetical protein
MVGAQSTSVKLQFRLWHLTSLAAVFWHLCLAHNIFRLGKGIFGHLVSLTSHLASLIELPENYLKLRCVNRKLTAHRHDLSFGLHSKKI